MSLDFHVIWVNGMPRSGTSWLGQIFDSHPNVKYRLAPLFSYTFKNVVDDTSSVEEWNHFLKSVYDIGNDDFLTQQKRRDNGDYPRFLDKKTSSTHLSVKHNRFHHLSPFMLQKLPYIKIVHIVRNPLAAISSWLKAPREFPQELDYMEHWRTGKCRKTNKEEFWGFDDWVIQTRLYQQYHKDYPQNCYLVKYEDLVLNSISTTTQIFEFAGLEMNDQTKQFLIDSHSVENDNEYAVFKNKEKVLNRWKDELDPRIREAIITELTGTDLEIYLQR